MSKSVLKSGVATVAAAGTAVPLTTASVWARGLKISAPAANVGAVFIGDSSVDATNGFEIGSGVDVSFADLFGGEAPTLNLSHIYVDAVNSGDKVTFVYLEPAS